MDVIRKVMQGSGVQLLPGEVVDTSSWRNKKSLRGARYIDSYFGEVRECPECGRKFAEGNYLGDHLRIAHGIVPQEEVAKENPFIPDDYKAALEQEPQEPEVPSDKEEDSSLDENSPATKPEIPEVKPAGTEKIQAKVVKVSK